MKQIILIYQGIANDHIQKTKNHTSVPELFKIIIYFKLVPSNREAALLLIAFACNGKKPMQTSIERVNQEARYQDLLCCQKTTLLFIYAHVCK